MDAAAQQNFAYAFLSILFEGIPFVLFGTIVSGFIDIYMPPGLLERWLPRRTWLAVLMASLLGGIFPVCECAIVPVIRRLVSKGLPVSCALAFMLAAPIFNPITAYSTWQAFTGQQMMIQGQLLDASLVMMVLRCGLGVAVACLIGWATLRVSLAMVLRKEIFQAVKEEETSDADVATLQSFRVLNDDTRLIAAMRSALKDFVDVAVYFTIGVAITALFNTGIAPSAADWLDSLASDSLGGVAALMGLAFVLSLCSSSDAFIAATLAKFTYGAKLAFLTLGPMLDLKLLFLYQTLLRGRFILLMAIGIALSIFGAAVLFQWYLSSQTLP